MIVATATMPMFLYTLIVGSLSISSVVGKTMKPHRMPINNRTYDMIFIGF
jgi:hypothetical protein